MEPNTTPPVQPAPPSQPTASSSRIERVWIALIAFLLILILLLVFILQNTATVEIHYLGLNGKLSFGVAMICSAVVGALLTVLLGSARILQLRLKARQQEK